MGLEMQEGLENVNEHSEFMVNFIEYRGFAVAIPLKGSVLLGDMQIKAFGWEFLIVLILEYASSLTV